MFQILNSKQLAHIGEEVEEHQEQPVQPSPKEFTDAGPYFAAAVIGLAIIGFFIFKFVKKKLK